LSRQSQVRANVKMSDVKVRWSGVLLTQANQPGYSAGVLQAALLRVERNSTTHSSSSGTGKASQAMACQPELPLQESAILWKENGKEKR